MYSDEELDSAVQAGVMTEQTAADFRTHVADTHATSIVDEERFRLVTGFNDIFVVIACILLLVSIGWIGSVISIVLGGVFPAVTSWFLAEFFTRKSRMALPSIVLLLSFVGSMIFGSQALLIGLEMSSEWAGSISSLVAVFAAWVHWQRFKVPITVAAGVVTLVTAVIFSLLALIPEIEDWIIIIMLLAGIVVFLFAMWWDAADRNRQTRRSDVAFWIHLIAAPMIVHPVFSLLSFTNSTVEMWQAITVTMLYLVIGLVSISIDRRALMVSALAYVLYVFSSVLEQYGVVSLGFAVTAAIVGSGLLLLSAFWHTCRRAIVRHYPLWLKEKLPVFG